MVVVLIGPPGCGKGTQSAFLAPLLNVPVLATGNILRAVGDSGTPLGKRVREVLDSGALVDDSLVNDVIAERLRAPECANGAILDGYPRTVVQAEALDRLLESRGMGEAIALNFEIDEITMFSRLGARRYCPVCGRVYNLISQPPAELDFCDDDGMVLVTRSDDAPDVIRQRMRAYDEQTAPVVRHFRGRLHRVDATAPTEAVFAEIEQRLRAPVALATRWS